MNQKRDLPALVIFAFVTLLTSFSWVGFEIYRTLTDAPDPIVPSEILLDLEPTLDQVTLEGLVTKIYLEEDEIGDTVLTNPNSIAENLVDDLTQQQEDQIEEEDATISGIIESE